MNNKILELKKDISTPNAYYRAGMRKSAVEWEGLFPKSLWDGSNNEWFIDVTIEPPEERDTRDMAGTIVRSIFHRHGLRSISYKEAAVKACIAYGNYVRKRVILEENH